MIRVWLPLAILLAVAGCQDATAPATTNGVAGLQLQEVADFSLPPHILQQAPAAPPLDAYQVSFWAYKQGPASTITVSYQDGEPFLGFHIPRNSLQDFAGSDSLQKGDSILITLTVDPVSFLVDFQPSGLLFSGDLPASLAFCLENANPDLNGDGVVDSTDQALQQQLAIWSQPGRASGWFKLSAVVDTTGQALQQQLAMKSVTGRMSSWFKLSSNDDSRQQCVAAPVFHFSEYAIAW